MLRFRFLSNMRTGGANRDQADGEHVRRAVENQEDSQAGAKGQTQRARELERYRHDEVIIIREFRKINARVRSVVFPHARSWRQDSDLANSALGKIGILPPRCQPIPTFGAVQE